MSEKTSPSAPQSARPSMTLYVIKQVELAVRARLDALLKPSGLTALQYTALSILNRQPSMTSSDLARGSFVRAQSMADLVGALMRHGLIERAADPENRRRLLISLTEAGKAFIKTYDPLVAELEEQMLRDLDAAERDAFRRFLAMSRQALAEE